MDNAGKKVMKTKPANHTHKGYNESHPPHAKPDFAPDNAKDKHPLAAKPKKQRPAVAEKKMQRKKG